MSTSEVLKTEKADGILRLTINRPERRNALNDALIAQLTQAFVSASLDPEVRVLVLSAVGDKAFCAGADLNPSAGTFGFDYSEPTTTYAELLRTARKTAVPVIGRINGFCLAGGMGLLAICDMAVAGDTAEFGLPECPSSEHLAQIGA
ncbi:enoyl-CoA hydratase-related protein [Paracoccus sp. SCSIO 75233]|uniref:enoyl-CoA hydratase-related protein n=1 Tax=Paracoccus sp. SCSIO 75233 TaxID=3017782 RepID=UPI0022F12373|nr:enoyl-CoA hydratase-related protein [Paracoccus sp. SCSIO 75233]WBU52392.1 enoyl-CoA hydratase-related protein [Paracoccus sp. SCSIO 75233]